jgi:ubiquinone/menaquinone biosynthesis C-methylase UbiE
MDLQALIDVNKLWYKIYPYTAEHALSVYGKKSGKVLEMGVFSGGISKYLADTYKDFDQTIVTDDPAYTDAVASWLKSEGIDKVKTFTAPLDSTPFNSDMFDLVILRGAFFFIRENPSILSEIYRILKPGGTGFVGGGFGKGVPDETIDEIKEESKIQNDNLGRVRVTISQLQSIINTVKLDDKIKITEEGGVWLEIKKDM